MKIYTAYFTSSNADYKQCPHDGRAEVAFIGRSNVGKSSLINALLQRKKLAKTSKTPGKTARINHFLVNNHLYFVDLPGYGWAQVGHAIKTKWEKMLRDYLLYRTQMLSVFLLIDSKIAPQDIDLAFMRWLGACHIPFAIVFTKADRKNKIVAQKNYRMLMAFLEKDWTTMPPIFLVSAHDKLGMEAVLAYIQNITAKQPK
ncbi:ribosome biogenesis GTP-binding protein YihA/YsxC [Candidatus Cardinium hertigii]|uniref:Probable GTP-binding protein EngB n=1 Tax=Candidatus Cardinium hertigii TaxID=247481 RepID=A0A3N2QC40_9BACT|nr:ribosome biogenesis GTP-binding protein YihA/YsxC [Candidatus Cardinium hertigii]ROT47311.1 YihA family ribosome biogenesis GTP-binding protein [Candidatus Cardinium hertigii]